MSSAASRPPPACPRNTNATTLARTRAGSDSDTSATATGITPPKEMPVTRRADQQLRHVGRRRGGQRRHRHQHHGCDQRIASPDAVGEIADAQPARDQSDGARRQDDSELGGRHRPRQRDLRREQRDQRQVDALDQRDQRAKRHDPHLGGADGFVAYRYWFAKAEPKLRVSSCRDLSQTEPSLANALPRPIASEPATVSRGRLAMLWRNRVTDELFAVGGKVALVTGGTSGIGLMIARGLLRRGVRTYIVGRDLAQSRAIAAELSADGNCIGAGCRPRRCRRDRSSSPRISRATNRG